MKKTNTWLSSNASSFPITLGTSALFLSRHLGFSLVMHSWWSSTCCLLQLKCSRTIIRNNGIIRIIRIMEYFLHVHLFKSNMIWTSLGLPSAVAVNIAYCLECMGKLDDSSKCHQRIPSERNVIDVIREITRCALIKNRHEEHGIISPCSTVKSMRVLWLSE